MKKILSSLGLALLLVSIPQILSADEAPATDKVEVIQEDTNATEVQDQAKEMAEEKAEEAAKASEETKK